MPIASVSVPNVASRPTRGAWIEIGVGGNADGVHPVAPHTGRVD